MKNGDNEIAGAEDNDAALDDSQSSKTDDAASDSDDKKDNTAKHQGNGKADENAKDFIEYIDNTRDLEYKATNGLFTTRAKTEYDFTICLNRDCSDVVSYKWDNSESAAYDFCGMRLDDDGKYFVYHFKGMGTEEKYFVASPDVEKVEGYAIGLSGKTEEQAGRIQ